MGNASYKKAAKYAVELIGAKVAEKNCILGRLCI